MAILSGNSSNNTLVGTAGVDTIRGGNGTDSLTGGAGADIFLGRGGEMIDDWIMDFASGDRIRLLGETFTSENMSVDRGSGGVFLQLDLDTDGGNDTTIKLPTRAYSGNFQAVPGVGYTDIILASRTGAATNETYTGTGDHDSFDGAAGNDIISGRSGNDSLAGGAGNDVVDGGGGNDILDGGVGNDTLMSGPGNDSISGGAGVDIFAGRTSDFNDDLIRDFSSSDRIRFFGESFTSNGISLEAASDPASGGLRFMTTVRLDVNADGSGDVTFVLSNFSSALMAIPSATYTDVIVATNSGTAAVDSFIGSNGNDVFNGLAGDDVLRGGDGIDTLSGADGNDRLYGDGRNDLLDGGAGEDIIVGGSGYDSMTGGLGNDIFMGTTSDLSGDRIIDFRLGDRIRILGENFNNRLLEVSRAVNETTLRFDINQDGSVDTELYLSGGLFAGQFSTVAGSGYTDIMLLDTDGTAGVDQFIGTTADEMYNGLAGNDVLDGRNGSDTLFGGAGNDILFGGTGSDIMSGDEGNDSMIGGPGNDSLSGGAGADLFIGRAADMHEDRITDFTAGDRIRVLGTSFGTTAVSAERDVSETVIRIDINNDREPDMTIYLSGAGFSLFGVAANAAGNYTDITVTTPAARTRWASRAASSLATLEAGKSLFGSTAQAVSSGRTETLGALAAATGMA